MEQGFWNFAQVFAVSPTIQDLKCFRVMHSIALFVEGETEHDRVIRRTLMRYLNLTLILVLRSISSAVKRRFPTMDHLVEGGGSYSTLFFSLYHIVMGVILSYK